MKDWNEHYLLYLQCSLFTIPNPGCEFFYPGSRVLDLHQRIKVFITLKTVSKLSENWSGMFIPNPRSGSGFFPHLWFRIRIPNPGVKKAPYPGSATLTVTMFHACSSAIKTLFGWSSCCNTTVSYLVTYSQCCGSGIRDPVPFWPLDPDAFFPDTGSQTHIFESLVTHFWGKKFYNSVKIGPNFFL